MKKILEAFVEYISERSNILQVVSQYTTLNRDKRFYLGRCPLPFHNHSEKNPLVVFPDENFFFCNGCKVGGDVFKFISLVEGVSYFQAVELQAQNLGIDFPDELN